jgi:hypothetical protein
MQVQRPSLPTNPCPVCRGTSVVRIDPNSLNFAAATHRCETCGSNLKSVLKWSTGALTVAIGLLFISLGLAAYEASKQLPAIPHAIRLIVFLSFLGAVFGYSANRVLKAIEYKLWQPGP